MRQATKNLKGPCVNAEASQLDTLEIANHDGDLGALGRLSDEREVLEQCVGGRSRRRSHGQT